MKKLGLVFLFAILLCAFCAAVFAQETTADKSSPPLNPKEVEQIRKSAEGLRTVFGIEDPKADDKARRPNEKVDSEKAGEKKTMADVADKAVDMAGKMVAQAAESLQKVAPEVWRIMIKQQYANAISNIIPPILFLVIIFAYYKTLRMWCPDPDKQIAGNDNQVAFWWLQYPIPTIAAVASGIYFTIALTLSIKYLINPEFYAIRDILVMILNKGNPG